MIIVTDSAADIPQEEAQQEGITIAPLHISFPDGQVSSDEITPDEFYTRLVDMQPQIPTTSQPSKGFFASIYDKLAEKKEEILSIHISSGLSGTLDSARSAANDQPSRKIHLVDTLTLSGGQRFQVLAAARAARLGWSLDAILERLRQIREHTEVTYTLDTLTYLARGGRIGRVQALAGSLLKIKPIIRVEKADGKYSTVGKERTIARALESIRDHLKETYGNEPLRVTILHGQFSEQARILANLLSESLTVRCLETLRVSPVLGVHTGPGVVGAAVVPERYFEDL